MRPRSNKYIGGFLGGFLVRQAPHGMPPSLVGAFLLSRLLCWGAVVVEAGATLVKSSIYYPQKIIVDEALRKAYARCFGIGLLNPEGTRSDQTDPTFYRDLMGLKTKAGGMGYRNTERRSCS